MRVLSPAEMRAVDRHAIDRLHVPGVALMENAGAAVAQRVEECVFELAPSGRVGRVIVLCGPGNNGGDGFVTARWLASKGLSVAVYALCTQNRIAGDALTHLNWLKHCGIEVEFATSLSGRMCADMERADVIVDAPWHRAGERGLRPACRSDSEGQRVQRLQSLSIYLPGSTALPRE